MTRERLLSAVWGYSFVPHTNVVDVCIRRLRQKIRPGPDRHDPQRGLRAVRVSGAAPARPRPIGERWLVEALLVAFCAASIVLMLTWKRWEALPFHFVYVSVSIVYGIRMWRWQRGVAAIVLVALSTGLATMLAVVRGSEDAPELLEVPMMSLIFLAMCST